VFVSSPNRLSGTIAPLNTLSALFYIMFYILPKAPNDDDDDDVYIAVILFIYPSMLFDILHSACSSSACCSNIENYAKYNIVKMYTSQFELNQKNLKLIKLVIRLWL